MDEKFKRDTFNFLLRATLSLVLILISFFVYELLYPNGSDFENLVLGILTILVVVVTSDWLKE